MCQDSNPGLSILSNTMPLGDIKRSVCGEGDHERLCSLVGRAVDVLALGVHTFFQKSTGNWSIKHKLFIIHPNLFYRLQSRHFPESTSVFATNSLLCFLSTENGCLEVVI